jgi:hypothetical protein
MRSLLLAFALVAAGSGTAQAQAPTLKPPLDGLAFLSGEWLGEKGVIADTGGTSRGRSSFTPQAGGGVLLRRDHADLFDAAGKPTGGFDLIMMIYAEGGTVHADYDDGDHVIHYASAVITPGRSVEFDTAPSAPGPAFRLTYRLSDPNTLAVQFEIRPPGAPAFQPIATGSQVRAP